MATQILDVIVIGSGQAGLSMSYYLKINNFRHIIFEKGKVGDSWRSQRWDNFRLNTPNKMNLLPNCKYVYTDPDGFSSAQEFIALLEQYVQENELPLVEECNVIAVERNIESDIFIVSVCNKGKDEKYKAKQVVVASGIQNQKKIPFFSNYISQDIYQIHTSEYKNSSSLPKGSVLIVGTGQSGVQIADDLIDAGKKVFLSTSEVGRIPRRYKGKDVEDWLIATGFYETLTQEIKDFNLLSLRQPQISGVGEKGRTLSLQFLAKRGAIILGKMNNAELDHTFFQTNAVNNIKFGDESSNSIKKMIDNYIVKMELSPNVRSELDIADISDNTISIPNINYLNLRDNDITSIIWATGLQGDFSYLKCPVLTPNGILKQQNGISEIEGLYFLGLPWMYKRKSGIIWGIKDDAEFLLNYILAYNKI